MTNAEPGAVAFEAASLAQTESVRRWLASRAAFWRAHTRARLGGVDDTQLLGTLAQFCRFVGRGPDELVQECLAPAKEGQGLMLRMRARRVIVDEIERFEAEVGSREVANVARSFFIHNGVAMNPGILK